MIRTLGHARLKSGERLRVAALTAPAGRYAGPIRQFLAHKGQPWMMHVDLANEGKTDDLRTIYYVGLLGGEVAGNVMIVDDGRVGILGHVFTRPDLRRQGICQRLMAAAMDGFRAAGGAILTLGTGYNSAAYWIYHGFGFRSIQPGSGCMIFQAQQGAIARYFARTRARVADVAWHHWPGLSLLFMQAAGDHLRSLACRVLGPVGFEEGFLVFQSQRERLAGQMKVLVGRSGAMVGVAMLQRDARWPSPVHLLDLFVHPNFRGQEGRLLRALRAPKDAKVQAYLDLPSASRVEALSKAGYGVEATLRGQVGRPEAPTDVAVLTLET